MNTFNKIFRFQEYSVLLYRLLLAYVFYFIVRVLFFIYNYSLLKVNSIGAFFELAYYGLAFDTTAILYANSLFIVLSIIPIWYNTSKGYQKFLTYVYFTLNLIAFATNFIDFIYYKYIFSRTTVAVYSVLENETNKANMFFRFLISYWHVYLAFVVCAFLWIYLYKKVKVQEQVPTSKIKYYTFSTIAFIITGILVVGGIRGDFKKSTRPINMIDANRYVKQPQHADIVLNTPFSIIRTINQTSFKKVNLVDSTLVNQYFKPKKQYANFPESRPNIVLFITESYGREYLGSFNKDMNIPNYKGYTPFIDSLAQHSLIYTNAYANGRKSIHGMSSILAGIPSFKDAFTSSPYAKQKIQSIVSILNELGYDTSFFHGAPNGSMGFLGFSNILGFDHYYGKTEFNNDDEFDGSWGIWDEPFFHFMKETLDKKKTPFFSTIFTVSSHEPYTIPEKYNDKFPEGDIAIHKCVGYTDYAFKKFFEEAKKMPWYKNTIFIITADHGNLKYYDEYKKILNRDAVPILIFKPNSDLVGVNKNLAQQIDIYPTIMDLIGYNKPFRSWGRSLVGDKEIEPFVIEHNAGTYQLQMGKYICNFDGKHVIGYYDINDKGLEHNLINKKTPEMEKVGEACKAFVQDYMEKIIDQKLDKAW
ncbi:MAG: sulfatase-like hydrolase/transferase [Flavobacteriaceae bacterium]|nr:sulfatase-like hydrolase/transferase [Flavobacteriaceae bacterium]